MVRYFIFTLVFCCISSSLLAQKKVANVKDNIWIPRIAIRKLAKQIDDDKEYKRILVEDTRSMRFMRAKGCRYDEKYAVKLRKKIDRLSNRGYGKGLNLNILGKEVVLKQKKGEKGVIKEMALFYKEDNQVVFLKVKGNMSRQSFLLLGAKKGITELGLLDNILRRKQQ